LDARDNLLLREDPIFVVIGELRGFR